MHPVRKQRLYVVAFIVIFSSVAIGLMVYALSSNINLFYPPVDIAAGKAPVGQNIRAGGMVLEGSVKRAENDLAVRFTITDYKANVDVVYAGILPDLFAEGEGVVASGVLDQQGVLQATEVLAKHDENYMPPEVAEALGEAHQANSEAKDSYNSSYQNTYKRDTYKSDIYKNSTYKKNESDKAGESK